MPNFLYRNLVPSSDPSFLSLELSDRSAANQGLLFGQRGVRCRVGELAGHLGQIQILEEEALRDGPMGDL
jgi:hypothetical protein